MVLVEALARRFNVAVLFPRLRNHHHHRVRKGSARKVKQLDNLVERRRVASSRGDDWLE